MTERPILFSAPMVRAILSGQKTQTRRVVDFKRIARESGCTKGTLAWSTLLKSWAVMCPDGPINASSVTCPYGNACDRLYVKEAAWMFCEKRPDGTSATGRQKYHYVPQQGAPVRYCIDHQEKPVEEFQHPDSKNEWVWRKKIARFMPRLASRITLEITGVRVERLQDISDSDAWSEGMVECDGMFDDSEICAMAKHIGIIATDGQPTFACLWDSINAKRGFGWDVNPWVWVIEFKMVTEGGAK